MSLSNPILVSLDFSQVSSLLVDYAWRMAEVRGSEVHFLHVIPRSRSSSELLAAAKDDALISLQSFTGLPQGMHSQSIDFKHFVRVGTPAVEIVSHARENHIGTILMGTRGRSRLSHMVLGGVAEVVLRDAPCPVLVIPENSLRSGFVENETHPTPAVREQTEVSQFESLSHEIDGNRVVDLLHRAIQWRATDIHIDPISSERVWIRFRTDGKLRTFCYLDQSVAAPLLMQIKLMADFDTTQSFAPLEGRLKLPTGLELMDVRVTIVPTVAGEAVAMRLLKHEISPRPLSMLGMSTETYDAVETMLTHREGLVLVTGPTGTGKTTTVYAMLQKLGTGERNIVSIEDPVEYRVAGIRQLSVDRRHDFTIAQGLRTLLRMDPDVVFIGEIRDAEALEIAMRASSSGRYVFSTLHTRDVASTVTALRDLHVDSYSLAGNLTGIISQRLIRCLCRECRVARPTSADERQLFVDAQLDAPPELYHPVGCHACQNSGYYGRVGIFEAVVLNSEIIAAIQRGVSEDELRQLIRSLHLRSLADDALSKARDGITSLDEASSLSWT